MTLKAFLASGSLATSFILMINPATANTLEFVPSITATETYYDNITLSSTNKNAELVTQISPGFTLTAKGQKFQMNADYSLGYISYWESQFKDRIYSQGRLNANVKVIKKYLDVNLSAAVTQRVIDPTKSSAFDLRAITNNRTETRSLSINPLLRNRFRRYAYSFLNYRLTRLSYSTGQIETSYNHLLNYSLKSGKWFKRLNWTGDIGARKGRQSRSDYIQANGRINYLLSKKLTMFVTGQVYKRNYTQISTNTSRYFIQSNIGVLWTPSRKFSAEVGGGALLNSHALGEKKIVINQGTWRAKIVTSPTRRTSFEIGTEQAIYGRRNYSSFRHYTKKTSWSSTYAETLISPGQARNRIPGSSNIPAGAISTNRVPGLGFSELNRAVTNDVVLRKRIDANNAFRRKKISLNASVFYEKGEYQTSNQVDKRLGGNGGIQFKLTRQTESSISSSLQRYYFEAQNIISTFYLFKANVTRQLNKNTTTNFTYIWQKRNSAGRSGYTTNQIVAQIKTQF